jgi:membrane-associated phospholipid phosphatase
MSRAVGITTALGDLPDWLTILFALLTQLADFWFVFALCVLVYWIGPFIPWLEVTRARAAMVVAILIGAVALTVSLKAVVGLPRPPGAGSAPEAATLPVVVRGVYTSMATGDGYGFPSGHAVVATSMWGALAWAVRIGTRRTRLLFACTIIAIVGLSRLVLGVHYAVDVVVGVVIGGAFLWGALSVLATPTRVCGFAAVVAVTGLAVTGLTHDIGAAVGMSVAGSVVWNRLPEQAPPTRGGVVATVVLGVASVGTITGVALWVLADGITVLAVAATGTTVLIVLPHLGERVAKKAASVAG